MCGVHTCRKECKGEHERGGPHIAPGPAEMGRTKSLRHRRSVPPLFLACTHAHACLPAHARMRMHAQHTHTHAHTRAGTGKYQPLLQPPPAQRAQVREALRKIVVDTVLATDMKQHFTFSSHFNTKVPALMGQLRGDTPRSSLDIVRKSMGQRSRDQHHHGVMSSVPTLGSNHSNCGPDHLGHALATSSTQREWWCRQAGRGGSVHTRAHMREVGVAPAGSLPLQRLFASGAGMEVGP